MEFAIFGLGRMGMQIAHRLHKNNFTVKAWNRSEDARQEFQKSGGQAYSEVAGLVNSMTDSPRVFWVMLPNDVVEDFIFGDNGLAKLLKPGDILIDGGNSYFKDTVRRGQQLKDKGIIFYDSGTSGGVWGEKNGFALMVGGPEEQWPVIEPVFKALSSGKNYGLVGKGGAGHFVKMIHNGIEYGMMEAIAEGYSVMEASEFKPDLSKVTQIYQEGSVVRSWLIDLMADILAKEDIAGTSGLVRATGEAEWTIKTAEEMGIDVRVIKDSLEVRKESEKLENQNQFRNKILALLRKQFGGHAVDKK